MRSTISHEINESKLFLWRRKNTENMKNQKQGEMEKLDKNDASILLRLPEELKAALQRQAYSNGRRITAEINIRLRDSLKPQATGIAPLPVSYTAAHTPIVHPANDNGPANTLTDIDRAMLTIFHQLPPEKQLALLSLFR